VPELAEEFPPELLRPEALERVVAFIRSLPLTPATKRKKLGDWALGMKLHLDGSYYRRLAGGPTPW